MILPIFYMYERRYSHILGRRLQGKISKQVDLTNFPNVDGLRSRNAIVSLELRKRTGLSFT